MRAFVVRPFGTKNGIDFERVHRELIGPALRALDLGGGTTGDIVRQGNIREDMFQLLLTADLVVADISILNANVYYELGIRHGTREKRTFLLRCKGDDVPFDLKTDRYLEYDREDPGATLDALVAGLRGTLDSDQVDSPVFQLLPRLRVPELEQLLAVPSDFYDEVVRSAWDRRPGKLGLLGDEAQMFDWAVPGLRAVGLAQVDLNRFEAAVQTWSGVRRWLPADHQANAVLATCYQRLGDLGASDAAIQRALKQPDLSGRERAELQALSGRNAKDRWVDDWEREPDAATRAATALRSAHLREAADAYEEAFRADLNHVYSGLNALATISVVGELARRLPEVWNERFERDADAAAELARLEERRQAVSGAVRLALQTVRQPDDPWAALSVADFAFLTSTRPAAVADKYRIAAEKPAIKQFHIDSARRQLDLYRQLGLWSEKTDAAIQVLDAALRQDGASAPREVRRVLLFTGHRLDDEGRKVPRFPRTAEAERRAREMIRDAVTAQLTSVDGDLSVIVGYAGGASGGDILFHEVCRELGIQTMLLLASSRDSFARASVADAGLPWISRFNRLVETLETRYLVDAQTGLELPPWLRGLPDYSIWERSNLWMLHAALDHGASKVVVIALWNGEGGDGPGGTADLIDRARSRGAAVQILDAKPLVAPAG
jgi:hypothetical protein